MCYNNQITLFIHDSLPPLVITSEDSQLISFLKRKFFNFLGNGNEHIVDGHSIEVSTNVCLDDYHKLKNCCSVVRDGVFAKECSHGSYKRLFLYSFFSTRKLYKAIFREIRDFIHSILIDDSFILFHAACVTRSNFSFCIVGDKFAGKTTLMIKLLNQGFDLISNDKIYIKGINGIYHIVSLPISAGIRIGTLLLDGELYEKIKNSAHLEDIEFSSDARVHIAPELLSHFYSVNYYNHSVLTKIIYLNTVHSNGYIYSDSTLHDNLSRNVIHSSGLDARSMIYDFKDKYEFYTSKDAFEYIVSVQD